jgi:hypothetical protein
MSPLALGKECNDGNANGKASQRRNLRTEIIITEAGPLLRLSGRPVSFLGEALLCDVQQKLTGDTSQDHHPLGRSDSSSRQVIMQDLVTHGGQKARVEKAI